MYDDWNRYNQTPRPQPQSPTQSLTQQRPPAPQQRYPQPQMQPGRAAMPQYMPMPRQRRKSQWGAGLKALTVALCFFLAIAAGFAGGYIANMNRPLTDAAGGTGGIEMNQSAAQPQASPSEVIPAPDNESAAPSQTPFTFSGLANSPSSEAMTMPEAAAIARQSVVEIKTESVTSGLRPGGYISEGAGSGVIVSEDGYIITNDHVISGAINISVRLVDGREFPASLIGSDPKTDIAVIKISASGLPPATFGDSSKLVIGEGALAVGNPLGELGGTVTSGIISALDRELTVEGETMTLLQTDAAVNPGNSGGGLFNLQAELIGIVNSKSSGLNIEGLGFAVPSNIARAAANDIISYGYVRGRADTGIDLLDIQTAQAVRWYRVSQTGLYVVSSVDEQLKNGDRITAVNGREITDLYDFNEAMKSFSVGDEITITASRGNETISASITITEWKP